MDREQTSQETRVIRGGSIRTTTRRRRRAAEDGRPGRHYFVGRRKPLETLYDLVGAAVSDGALRLVNLCGGRGLGRTRLVEELVDILEGSGKSVRAYWVDLSDVSAPPMLSQLLRARFGLSVGQDPKEQLDQLALGVAELVPAGSLDDAVRLLASLMGLTVDAEGKSLPGFDPELLVTREFRGRARGTALNLFKYDTRQCPHLLVFDNWDVPARPADLQLAEALVALMADSPLTVVAISEQKLQPPVVVRAPGQSTHLALGPLDLDDSRRLVAGLLERVENLPDAVVDTTVSQAAGNPSMVLELVRLLEQRRVIGRDEDTGTWAYIAGSHTPSKLPLPRDVHAAVRERLDAFEETERAVLDAAAVLGGVFWERAVISLLRADGDVSADDADIAAARGQRVIGRLIRDGILEVLDHENLVRRHTALSFSSPALRDTAYQELDSPTRTRLHRLSAQWLSAATPVEMLPWLETWAQHLEDGHLPREAARVYLEAGSRARAESRPLDAEKLLRRGLSLSTTDAAATAVALLDGLARTYIETSEFDEAERCMADLMRYAAILDDDGRLARAHTLMGEVLRDRGKLDDAQRHLEQASVLFAEVEDAGGQADAAEVRALLTVQKGEKDAFATAMRLVEQALELRKAQMDPVARARTLAVKANLKYSVGEIEDAIRIHADALHIRERARDRRGELLSLNGLGVARYDNGQHEEAMALWERAMRIATELGDRAQRTILLMNLGEARLESGHLAEAEPALQEALDTATELGLARLEGLSLTLLSALQLARGSEEQATALADRAVDVAYGMDSKEVLGQALLAKARAMSNALFIADQEGDERGRTASECFQKAITLLEEMGERPTLVRALDAYGSFLLERGVINKGRKAIRRAEALRNEMRSPEDQQRVFHEARTIRRMPTGPMNKRDVDLVLDMMTKEPKG